MQFQVSVCNFDNHNAGQPAKLITYPVLLLTHDGLVGFSCPYISAKSASGWKYLAKLLARIQNQTHVPCSIQASTYPFQSPFVKIPRTEHASSATIEWCRYGYSWTDQWHVLHLHSWPKLCLRPESIYTLIFHHLTPMTLSNTIQQPILLYLEQPNTRIMLQLLLIIQ